MLYANSMIPTVKKALCDPLPEVRKAAARLFESLHSSIGERALDDVLPDLLSKLGNHSEQSEHVLDGLTQVMIMKNYIVLPYLIPKVQYKVFIKSIFH
ncbi:hypothetical protein DPMN_073542 [Dreissena polymorpha]|uniref:Uncharacterized protein n=1 Tax=Dreissena polymorpha TaxID=45954 RepID=A0A9D4BZB7_DREPO|nr:hypothetical protein DPMN_073542 [Dreissena polymorpha]